MQKAQIERTVQITNFIRLHSLHSSSHPSTQHLNITQEEVDAIYTAVDHLLGLDASEKETVISGFFIGEGEIVGIPCKSSCNLCVEREKSEFICNLYFKTFVYWR